MKQTKNDKLWAVIAEAALMCDEKDNTIKQWRVRGFVPPSKHHMLVTMAAKLNEKLTHAELHSLWQKAKLIR